MHPLVTKHKHVTITSVKARQKHTKHLPKSQLAEAYGWFGSVLILVAYALLSLGIIDSESPAYHAMFFIGSTGLALITYRHRAFQSFMVNVIFTVLALVALIRLLYVA